MSRALTREMTGQAEPVVLLQVRQEADLEDENGDPRECGHLEGDGWWWSTVVVFADWDEAVTYVAQNAHAYPGRNRGTDWQFSSARAHGVLRTWLSTVP